MKTGTLILVLAASMFCSVGMVTLLHMTSEEIIHRNNSFIRRYPHHPVTKENALDLKYNSYYIAGMTEDSIYLGNHTAPLHLLAADKHLKDTTHIKLHLNKMEHYQFRAVRIIVQEPYYYLADGTVPIIYKGNIGNWKAGILMEDKAYFSQIIPTGEDRFTIKARSSSTNENELGLIKISDSTEVKLQPQLLQRQIDGVFDVGGFLLYNRELKKVVYLYRYRNEYVTTDNNLDLLYRGKTIDTINQAQLDIIEIASKNQKKLGTTSIRVNIQAATSGPYLFTSSNRLGKFEPEKMLQQARIIDVYNLKNQTYQFSFYLYHFEKEKMREFIVDEGVLFSLNGKYLVRQTMKEKYFDF